MNFGGIGKTKYPLDTADATRWDIMNVLGALGSMLVELKKIVFHLSLGTDVDLKDQDVDT